MWRDVTEVVDRLWRARRRHDRLDAVLERSGGSWVLQFLHNDRPFLSRRYRRRDLAAAEAEARLKDLQQAGWHTHW
jgi:hypothetical protein